MAANGPLLKAEKNLYWQSEKRRRIEKALSSDPVDLSALRDLSKSFGGLLNQELRKKVWPKLVGVNVFYIYPYEGPPLSAHKERPQVLLDVNRCGKRIPPGMSEEQRKVVQGQLETVILRLLAENPELHYYQGLHDIVLTFLLATGQDVTYAIMSALVQCHIRDFLDPDMTRTKVIISSLCPLLAREDRELESFITRSECAYYFTLGWLITWYGHVVHTQADAHRLADVFLASHPLLPVYVASAIILTRREEVLEVECELSAVHGLLSKLPPDLKYEQMIELALKLFEKHPPDLLRKESYKLRHSALIKAFPRFCKAIHTQRPDHILKHEPPPPKRAPPTWWWAWLTDMASNRTFRTVLSIVGPVVVAMLVYLYMATPYQRSIQ